MYLLDEDAASRLSKINKSCKGNLEESISRAASMIGCSESDIIDVMKGHKETLTHSDYNKMQWPDGKIPITLLVEDPEESNNIVIEARKQGVKVLNEEQISPFIKTKQEETPKTKTMHDILMERAAKKK